MSSNPLSVSCPPLKFSTIISNKNIKEGCHPVFETSQSWKDLRRRGKYCSDKTGFLVELINSGLLEVYVPRGFGKSCIISMIREFFQLKFDKSGNKIEGNERFNIVANEDCDLFYETFIRKQDETCIILFIYNL